MRASGCTSFFNTHYYNKTLHVIAQCVIGCKLQHRLTAVVVLKREMYQARGTKISLLERMDFKIQISNGKIYLELMYVNSTQVCVRKACFFILGHEMLHCIH